MQVWGLIGATIAYFLLLFAVASFADRRSRKVRTRLGRGKPTIYALSLAIYCTSWTFFGSVGVAATSGLDFLAIYLGPILMITLGYPLMSHVISVAKSERITSIADFMASRYGKSTAVGAFAATIAVLGTIPYIALQLKAISTSFDTMIGRLQPSILQSGATSFDTSFFVSVSLAVFAVLFGTRHADATEHQDGLMLAIATESIVKLVAFLAVGMFVVLYLFDGVGDLVQQAQSSSFVAASFYGNIHPTRFLVYTLLAFCAFILLPRQFHVGVVENHSKEELKTARWMFPLYLVLINLFVLPVALAGMLKFGSSADADTYVLALPLASDVWQVSYLVFVGGLSAATAMVIVACVALAIMISNNMILPLVLRYQTVDEGVWRKRNARDMANILLNIRRTAIFIILGLAFAYYQVAGDSAALASIGLLSFAAAAQFAPAFFLGLFWRRPTELSALAGMGVGFSMWLYTLFLPSVLDANSLLLTTGPWGIEWLHPQRLFGLEMEPLNHGVFFSLLANTISFVVFSFVRQPKVIERMQARAFWILGASADHVPVHEGRSVTVNELKDAVANYLGRERCNRAFEAFYTSKNTTQDGRDLASDDVIAHSEQLLASAIGAASSRLVMSLLLQKHDTVGETAIQLLDDASEALQYNRDLLQTALDQVEQGISVFDKEFRLSSWNRQFRHLLDLPEELGQVGISVTKIAEALSIHIEDPIRSSTQLTKELLQVEKPTQLTLTASQRVVEVVTRSVPDGGLVISWNDMTERVNAARDLRIANETLEKRVVERTEELTRLNEDLAQAREAAEAANIGKTKFLAAVGHDILQPLNAARLYASTLVERLSKSDNRELADHIDDALDSVEDILGSVLAISRLDSGVLTPNITNFPADRLIKKLDVEFRPIAENKGLALETVSNGLNVSSDYSLLRRLLQNLVSNAIKYTPSGTVTLDARVKRNLLLFEVHDTGPGISLADQEVIFQEFHRLEAGKRVAPGLGLGLSIVKRLANTLEVDLKLSSNQNGGCTFTVAVPLAAFTSLEKVDERQPVPTKFDLSTITVYCIDNDPRILDGMEKLLSGWGCHVETFTSSDELISSVAKRKPDVLLADYHLDNENGLEVISNFRSSCNEELPAVLITADRSAAVRHASKSMDVSLLNKPLKPARLRALLTGLLHSSSGIAAE